MIDWFFGISLTEKTWNYWKFIASSIPSHVIVIYEALCFDVAQGRMNGAPMRLCVSGYLPKGDKSDFQKEKKSSEPRFISSFANKTRVKLTTVVDDDPKTRFLLATTPRCRRRRYSFPWIALQSPWSVHYNAEAASSTIFRVFGRTLPGIELCSPWPLANTFCWKFVLTNNLD